MKTITRMTKRYTNNTVSLDAEAFMETQNTIDREIINCYPAKKAIEKLAIYEDFLLDKGIAERLSWILDMEIKTDEDMMKAILKLIDDTYRNLSSRLGTE